MSLKKYFDSFELDRKYLTNSLPHKRTEWKNDIPIVNTLTFVSEKIYNEEEMQSYLKEEELLTKFENDKYIFRTLIFNEDYSVNEREKLIDELIEIFKPSDYLFDFISNSVEKQVMGFLEHQKLLSKSIDNFREERVLIYEDLLKEINSSSLNENEKFAIQDHFVDNVKILLYLNIVPNV